MPITTFVWYLIYNVTAVSLYREFYNVTAVSVYPLLFNVTAVSLLTLILEGRLHYRRETTGRFSLPLRG